MLLRPALSNQEGISWESRCIVFFAAALLAGLLKHLRFSLLPLHGFQRPRVNHVKSLELRPLMCRQGLCSLKTGIEIRAGQAGVVGGAARSPGKKLAKASHRVQGF